jgi:glycosidase
MGFHFPLMPRIFLALRQHSYQVLKDIMAQTPPIPDTCQWVTFLRNHDELTLEMVSPEERQYMWREYAPEPRMKLNLGIRRRLAPLFNNDRRLIEAAHSILFTMPGSPIIYYGDEIGMGDNIWLPDRNGVRTPMQWEAESPSAGFSPAARLYAPLVSDPTYCKERVNVKDAIKDPSSLFHVLKIMIHSRRKHSAFGFGSFHWIDSGNMAVAVWLRDAGFDKVIVLTNLDEKPQSAQFELPREAVHRSTPNPPYLVDILTSTRVPLQDRVLKITMDPYQFLWLIPLYSYPRGEDYMSV